MIEILALAAMVLADQLTKVWAVARLQPVHTMEIFPGLLNLTYVENTGAAFSLLRGQTLFLIVLPIIACALIGYLLVRRKVSHPLGRWSLVLIARRRHRQSHRPYFSRRGGGLL